MIRFCHEILYYPIILLYTTTTTTYHCYYHVFDSYEYEIFKDKDVVMVNQKHGNGKKKVIKIISLLTYFQTVTDNDTPLYTF